MKRMGSVVGLALAWVLALPGDHLLAAGKAKGSLEKRLAPLGKFADALARLLERRLPRWNPVYRAA